jgi:hypothetical protein
MRRMVFGLVMVSIAAWSTPTILGFCGFYTAKADTKLFNRASQVVIVRDGDRTVMTMANDFEGEPKEFAVVIPVPTFLTREQIHVGEKAVIDHLDAYSAPRLVEYFDRNPCEHLELSQTLRMSAARSSMEARDAVSRAKALGVTIEAQYTVGEYDILILSAQQNSGLETWLRQNGYRIPTGASEVIASYLRQNVRFFVAKVNLAAAGGIRVAEVHASDPARDGQRSRTAGAVHLRADTRRPGRDDELPYREGAGRYGSPRLPETAERVRPLLQGDVHAAGGGPGRPSGVSRVCVGHEMVRPMCRRSALDRRTAAPWRLLDGERRATSHRVCSSRACTSATTTRTFPRISSFRKRPIARISRDATSCVTPGPARTPVRLQRAIVRHCASVTDARPRNWSG